MFKSVHDECVAGTPHVGDINYLKWVIKTIEVVGSDVGDAIDSRKTHGHKQQVVALMACVLETCDLETYVDAHNNPEWETVMTK